MRYFVSFIKPNLKIFSFVLVLSLVNGVFFVPQHVNAGFFSSLFSTEAKAGEPTILSTSNYVSDDELALSTTGYAGTAGENIADVNIDSDNALVASTGPAGASGDAMGGGPYSLDNVDIYVVRKGDTYSGIADMFGITVDTILSANDLPKGSKTPKVDDVLLILSFSGVEHTVVKGQTIQGIANLYKVSVDEIIKANDIGVGGKIVVGEKLMIPGASMLSENKPKTTISSTAKSGSSTKVSTSGYFRHPLPGSKVSRRETKTHHGVDYAAPTGTPILASASGTVLIARGGWNGGYGNYVVIKHDNGTKTLYAHMSKIGTSAGARVSQGSVIGYVGNTGRSTGPHLHFETIGTGSLVPHF